MHKEAVPNNEDISKNKDIFENVGRSPLGTVGKCWEHMWGKLNRTQTAGSSGLE
jgi:hypothetical protein